MLIQVLTTIASIASVGFGVWHFFVPRAWHWYTYIDSGATELVLAIQAINIFFSLSLVAFGLANLILIWSGKSNRFSILVLLSVSVILWATRSVMQLVYPQGSINPILQYGMLFAFLSVTALYMASFVLTSLQKPVLHIAATVEHQHRFRRI